jgi:hypothetical protein
LSLTLREEQRLRLFENRVLGRILGSTREEVAGDWRRLHTEELHNLYASPILIPLIIIIIIIIIIITVIIIIIIRVSKSRMRWVGYVERMGEMRNEYNTLIGKSDEKKRLGKLRRIRED